MHPSESVGVKDIVLLGGGHSHVIVLRHFGGRKPAGLRITLISREPQAAYSGMLPGHIAGHYTFEETHIDLLPLCRFAGARFFHDEAVGLDLENKYVLCQNRAPVRYDVLSINTGSVPFVAVDQTMRHVTPIKPITGLLQNWRQMFERIRCHDKNTAIGVVGAGAAGIELLLAIQYRLQHEFEKSGRDKNKLAFHLFTEADDILVTYNEKVRAKFRRLLRERKIKLHPGHRVSAVSAHTLHCENDARFHLDEVLWATTAAAQKWPGSAGLDTDAQGFIKVNDTLESVSHERVFATGDIAHVLNHPCPKAGVFAVRQGAVLSDNLLSRLKERPLQGFKAQKQFLSLVSTGRRHAIASRDRWALEGRYVWHWKDWIDRRFMRKFQDLPQMIV